MVWYGTYGMWTDTLKIEKNSNSKKHLIINQWGHHSISGSENSHNQFRKTKPKSFQIYVLHSALKYPRELKCKYKSTKENKDKGYWIG